MRIVVNDIAAEYGGAMTILKQFYKYVVAHDTKNEWIFLLCDNYLQETENIKIICLPEIKKSKVKKILFDCLTGWRYLERLKPDVVISLQNIITFGVKCPQIVYIHQSIPFQNTKRFSLFVKEERGNAIVQYGIGALIKQSAKKADYVVVQTDWMRKSVSAKTGVCEDRIIQVLPEVDDITKKDTQSNFDNTLFFYPTNSEPYKNISLIEKACRILNEKGIANFRVSLTLPEGTITHNNIKCIGRLNQQQMVQKYSTETLVFPSLIETVGLPLLEARSCETIVLASDTDFARECLDQYENAYYFNPFEPEELANLMEAVITKSLTIQPVHKTKRIDFGWAEMLNLVYNCVRKGI